MRGAVEGRARTARGSSGGGRALAALALALSLLLATAAHAQLGDVGEDVLDTDVTPVAKESVKWEWWAGARYRGAPKPKDVPQGSPTPFELDFFDVAFSNLDNGLAGGAICREPVPERASPEEARAHTEQCERVPALYRYSVDAAGNASWSPLDLGESAERRGYAGAIAWLDSDTALAVGGDGCYPRREQPCPDGDTPPGDPAGMARAWLYDAGSVSELTDLPAQMRGLTALGTHSGGAFAGALRQIWRYENGAFTTGWSGDASAPQEVRYPELFQYRVRDIRGARAATAGCCRTDPLQSAGPRLLTFDGTTWIVGRRSSDFSNTTERFDDQSKSEPVGDPFPGAFGSVQSQVESQWNSIELTLSDAWDRTENNWDNERGPLEDGERDQFSCKRKDGGNSAGRGAPIAACTYNQGITILNFNPFPEGLDEPVGEVTNDGEPEPWPINLPHNLVDDPDDPGEESVLGPFGLGSPPDLGPPPDVLPPPPDTSDVRDPVNESYRNAFGQLYGATKFTNGWGVDGHSVNTHTQAQAPDSYYALFGAGGTVASPGGPPPSSGEDEPGSVISSGPSLLLTAARIVSADQSPVKGGLEAVGMLRSSGQGILVGEDEHDPHRVNDSLLGNLANPKGFLADEEAHGCEIQDPDPPAVVENGIEQPECDTNAQRFLDQQRSLRLFKLDSYALNAIEVVEGAGWAVGDHGAIHARKPPPPPPPAPPKPPARAGAKLESESVSTNAFEERRPTVTDEPGVVPSLAGQPQTTTTEPGFQGPYGPSISQGEVVMSRDGSEGWALDKFADEFLHYDGARWVPCDAWGVPGLLPPDPACTELAKVNGQITAVARVPLENDSDPSNDDEFEAVALTSPVSQKVGLYRYRDGRWSYDKDAVYRTNAFGPLELKPLGGEDIAFTAPDDGWVVQNGADLLSPPILHFNGERWVNCGFEPSACGNLDGRLTIRTPCTEQGGGIVGLSTAGERVYLFSVREGLVSGSGLNACTQDPEALSSEPYPVILYHDRGGTWRGGVDPDFQNGVDTTPEDGYNPADGGWDPGCVHRADHPSPTIGVVCEDTGNRSDQGRMGSLSVARAADGSFQGWALGAFGGRKGVTADAAMMRLSQGHDVPGRDDEGTAKWRQWHVPDAANEHLRGLTGVPAASQLSLPSGAGQRSAFMFAGQALGFDQARNRWTAIPTPWAAHAPSSRFDFLTALGGGGGPLAPDGQGGFWAGAFHYTDHAPEPVFEHTPDPAKGTRITAFAAGADGTVWLADEEGFVYRYDRLTGWSRKLQIPGWDPKQATSTTAVSAIAAGPWGEGIAVGPGGRIATLGDEVGLDPAATVSCGTQDRVPPCGTAKDLFAAAMAPDGSAIVLGKENTLLWRPANGEFRLIDAPPVPLSPSTVTSPDTVIEMPQSDRAYVLADGNRVIRGDMGAPGEWRWEFEIGDAAGRPDPLTRTRPLANGTEVSLAIRDIAVDASGHGYAVGDSGLVLERTGEGAEPWRRVPSGYGENLQEVTLPAGRGEGALIGGPDGLILTLTARGFEVARHANPFDPVAAHLQPSGGFGRTNSRIPARFIALALVPGYRPGDVEAWALLQGDKLGESPQALLHFAGATQDSALDPVRGLLSLPDAPPPAPGETSFAAFGKQDCDATSRSFQRGGGAFAVHDTCGPPDGSNITADLINRRVREELAESSGGSPGAQFALFTGDATDLPGGTPRGDGATEKGGPFPLTHGYTHTPIDGDIKHRRWVELVAHPLEDAGVPLFGAIGGQDLARNAEYCPDEPGGPIREVLLGGCISPRQAGAEQFGAEQGLSLPWRAAMASSPAPWESEQVGAGLRFEPAGSGVLSMRSPDAATPEARPPAPSDLDPLLEELDRRQAALRGPRIRVESYPLDSGNTHYAADVLDEETGEKIARIVVLDTSMRSIAASDPQQHPIEAGGQLRWLDEMTCFEGSAEDLDSDVRDCTREPGQQAIVVSNTPTYSYGPISPEETQTDAAVFESVLFKNQVNVVVSGRLGWQGRYWALAPGVHAPCPGQPYRADSEAPSVTSPEICGAGGGEELDPDEATEQLPDEARNAAGLAGRGAIPFVVSSSAGGRFNVRAERGGLASAAAGFWRGYSLVRLHPSGDPAKTIVEQRPILDWVGIGAREQELEPRAEVDMRGYAREAFGMDTMPRYYDIPDHEGITHRYHLLLAHPDEPWRACEVGDSGCEAIHSRLSEGSRSFDSASSEAARSAQDDNSGASASAIAGEGDNPCEPYLCLPELVGSIDPITGEVKAGNGKYPDTFGIATISVGDHVATAQLVFKRSPSFIVNPAVGSPAVPSAPASTGTAPAPPPPPNPPTPNVPQASTPQPPPPSPIAPLQATQPPEPQPPVPPAPPPPSEAPAPISLTLAPPSIAIATPTAVIQPPTPPVNPAPPGGARREARQRQAAAQKSGADSEEVKEGGDLANRPPSADGTASMTRLEARRPEPSFTPLVHPDQPSAWATGALYTGGITIMGLALALTWTRGRPMPRRRAPEIPAAAWAESRRRR